jgi:predicted nuclease with RNAse H fold
MTLLKVSKRSDAQNKMQKEIIEYLQAHGVTKIETFDTSTSSKKTTSRRHGLVVKG